MLFAVWTILSIGAFLSWVTGRMDDNMCSSVHAYHNRRPGLSIKVKAGNLLEVKEFGNTRPHSERCVDSINEVHERRRTFKYKVLWWIVLGGILYNS